jgi:hypothetical protein
MRTTTLQLKPTDSRRVRLAGSAFRSPGTPAHIADSGRIRIGGAAIRSS